MKGKVRQGLKSLGIALLAAIASGLIGWIRSDPDQDFWLPALLHWLAFAVMFTAAGVGVVLITLGLLPNDD